MNSKEAMDNPFWPNKSAVEVAKDKALHLPPPSVCGAKWTMSADDIECLIAGVAILSSGGGGDPKFGRDRSLLALKEGKKLEIVNPCRIKADEMGLVCAVAVMGNPMAITDPAISDDGMALLRLRQTIARDGNYKVSEMSKDAFVASPEDLKNFDLNADNIPLTKRITGLIAVETGGCNTTEPLLASATCGLPALDVAGMGRSFPRLEMYMPFIYGCKCYPASLATVTKETKGEDRRTITCVGVNSPEDLETLFIDIINTIGKQSVVALGAISFEDVFEKTALFATSQAWQLGRAIIRAMKSDSSVLQAIVNHQHGFVLISGKIIKVDTKNPGGFTLDVCVIQGMDEYAGHFVKLTAQNEIFVADRVDSDGNFIETLATVPDIISIVNLDASTPIDVTVTAGNETRGMMVGVVVLPADCTLYTSQALKVMGPRAFGLDMDYKPPQLLKNSL